MGGAMSLGMQRKITTLAMLFAGGLLGAGCGHRAGDNPLNVAALQPPAPREPGPAYRIQVGDELHVRFLYQPDMTEVVPVRPDGRISLAAMNRTTLSCTGVGTGPKATKPRTPGVHTTR